VSDLENQADRSKNDGIQMKFMRTKGIAITAVVLVALAAPGIGQTPTASNRADWFREAKFGMFVHWGLYSILEGSYGGKTLPDTTWAYGNSWYAEWIQQRLRVPEKAYRALVGKFNPEKFDADAWILEAKNAGMKYFVITAKHHDGFALWDSKVSTYDMGSGPYKKDVLGELAKACKKYGLKLGFYYSHCEDWEHPGGATPSWTPQKSDAAFQKYWDEKCLPQVTELLQRYSPDLLWFDTWGDEQEKIFISDKRRDQLITLIRSLSPKTLINGRISWLNPGNDIDFLEMMDNDYPDRLQERPWQTPATMQESWGWHAKDYHWKPAAQMISYLLSNTAKGGNYLLNIGPKADGSLPPMAIRRLREMGGWLAANGEAVYGAKPVEKEASPGTVFTHKTANDGTEAIYVSLLKTTGESELILPFAFTTISDCSVLETAMPLSYTEAGHDQIKIQLPPAITDESNGVQVIKIKLKKLN